MERLKQWIAENDKQFTLVANVVIGLLATFFILTNIYKMMKALSGGNLGDAGKNFLYAVLIAVIALISITGIKNFVKNNQLGNDLIQYGNP